ncbi:MAG: YraN family protein [Steroidobacteraceae bacterium]
MTRHYRQEAGDRGEDLALRHLQAAGLKLLQRNYRCAGGEIDLVMSDGQTLVLVEVRFRRDRSFGGAAASVDVRKQQRLMRAAQHLLQTHAAYRRQRARFDLIAIDGEGAATQINWIRDAFRQ